MTNKERYELHDWIAVNVIGWHEHDPRLNSFNPTSSSKDAMDVLKKCAERCGVRICHYKDRTPNVWDIYATDGRTAGSQAETLELAICLFAKQLFSQTTK